MSRRLDVIDVVRGFCLLNIFVNHVTLGVLREGSFSKFAMSDAAEIFVFLAGVSVFLYAERKREHSTRHVLRRAAQLYAANIAIILATIVLLFVVDLLTGETPILERETLAVLRREHPTDIARSIVMFSQTYGYSVVLRLYVFLMCWAPVAIWLARRHWWLPLVPALLIWLVAGHFRLVLADEFTGEMRALTWLPWILVFSLGISFAAGMLAGISLSRSPWLMALAGCYLLAYPVVGLASPYWPLAEDWVLHRNWHFWFGGSKTYQSPARLLYLIAGIYLFVRGARLPVIRLFHEAGPSSWLARLGRASLPVFMLGAVLSLIINEALYQAILVFGSRSPQSMAIEVALVASGLGALTVAATITEKRRRIATNSDGPGRRSVLAFRSASA